MDGQRFDRWTRSLAPPRSRRTVAKGAAAGALGLALGALRSGTVGAQEGRLPPGAPCTETPQCSQSGGPVVCASNGIVDDSALNCCRNEGGFCGSDAGCCGAFNCIQGVCTSGDAGTSGGTASGTLALGAVCSDTSQCAPSSGGTVICGDNGIGGDGDLNCCLQAGGGCGTDDTVCCGTMTCVSGACSEPQFGDLGPGDVCAGTIDCSQSLGPATCAAGSDGASRCCLLEATSCSTDAECCGGLVCAENGIASDGGLNCCGGVGSACQSDAACCADFFCISGSCQPIA